MSTDDRPDEPVPPFHIEPGERVIHEEPQPETFEHGEFEPGISGASAPVEEDDDLGYEPFSPVNEPDPGPLPEGPSPVDDI